MGEELSHQEGVVAPEAPGEGLPQGRELRAEPAAGQAASTVGSVVPATRAVSMARPETPRCRSPRSRA